MLDPPDTPCRCAGPSAGKEVASSPLHPHLRYTSCGRSLPDTAFRDCSHPACTSLPGRGRLHLTSSPACSTARPALSTDLGEKEGPTWLPAQDPGVHASCRAGPWLLAAPGGGGSPAEAGAAGKLSHRAACIRASPRPGSTWEPCMHKTRRRGEAGAAWAWIPLPWILPSGAAELGRAQAGQGLLPFGHQKVPHHRFHRQF